VNAPRRPARAEVVGSLLRPQRLLEAAGGPAAREVVDAEVRAAVARQIDLGLDVVTDGEFGRAAFTHSFYDAIDGIEPSPVPVRFRNAAGEKVLYRGVPRIAGRLRKVDSPLAREADLLRSITDRPFKVTLPAASWFLPAAFYEPGGAYASHDELLEDTLAIQRELSPRPSGPARATCSSTSQATSSSSTPARASTRSCARASTPTPSWPRRSTSTGA
jgi:5-methyltetrahydropteroyltriglutamate--homocysteine methyltransferase